MIYIDPSELRSTSKLKDYLGEVEYEPLPELEERTGADLIITPSHSPKPATDELLEKNILDGAFLVQVKFDHDLISSIFDGRLKWSLIKMREAKAAPWQRILPLFIGFISHDDELNLFVNKRPIHGNKNFKWLNYLNQRTKFIARGGMWHDLYPPKDIEYWLLNQQLILDQILDDPIKTTWPAMPILYEEELEYANDQSFITREWLNAQKLEPIKDLRKTLITLPGLGETLINNLWNWMSENGVKQDWNGFSAILNDGRIEQVPKIGKGKIDAIRWYLYRTEEERKTYGK